MDTPIQAPSIERAAALAAELRGLVGKLKRRLRDQADLGDFTPSQTSALLCLSREGPMTVTALAEAEGVRSQSMGAIVTALEALGHIQRAKDPGDGRQTIVSLTPAFEAWLRDGRAARQGWLARALQTALTSAELAQLASAVELLKRVADA